MLSPSVAVAYRRFEFQRWEEVQAETIVEAPLSVTVNGQVWLTLMCTPTDVEALALGFLYNEGVIESLDEVADVHVCEHGDNVDIWLYHSAERPLSWRRTSGCSGGMTAVDAQARAAISLDGTGPILTPQQVEALVEQLLEGQELYRETGGVHTSALSDGERMLLRAEDIGRHNTLDKIAGLMLLKGVWPEHRVLVTTGRISSEMLQKAARLQATVLISRTSPNSLSIALAERYGITLIGYARRHRFNLYTHPQRIAENREREGKIALTQGESLS
ncbi:MAG: formate dehydrogenase accessory sulfurtransferase FdhD [Anaerolineales bacterium]